MPAEVKRMELRRRAPRPRSRVGDTGFEEPADTKTFAGNSSGISLDLGLPCEKRNLVFRVSDEVH
jgi:hypothetical protein